MTVDAVLLDYGGTLDADGVHWSTRLHAAFRAAGVDLSRDACDRAFFVSEEGLAADAATRGLGLFAYVRRQAELMAGALGLGAAGLASRVAEHFVAAAKPVLARSRAALAHYRPRFRLAIVSNFYANLPLILEEVGLDRAVDAVVVSEIAGIEKPDPRIFARALAALGVPPERAAMVGDSLRGDVAPARAAGMTAVWVRGDAIYGGGDPAQAHHVVASAPEALAWLAARAAGEAA